MSGKRCLEWKISVIVPVYNSESYIRECLASVLNQTYRNIEILVVDDGSVDRSVEVCEELRKRDRRIRIFRQTHCGVSAARNRGIYEASGRYVFFIDSDDMIHPYLLEALVMRAGIYDTDLLFCTYRKVHTAQIKRMVDRSKTVHGPKKCRWEEGERSDALGWFHEKRSKELSCIGGKMIRRDRIGEVRFDEELSKGEDTVLLYRLCSKGMKMSYLDEGWYYYRTYPESITAAQGKRVTSKDFGAYKIIRTGEAEKGNIKWALLREYRYMWKLLSEYLAFKTKKDKKNSRILKQMTEAERSHPLYGMLPVRTRVLFSSLYLGCSYVPHVRGLWRFKQRIMGGKEYERIDLGNCSNL